jgi:hypothetical protein
MVLKVAIWHHRLEAGHRWMSQRERSSFGQPKSSAERPLLSLAEGKQTDGSLKSFGRRRRTKVVDERTRGEQALVYGEFDF